MVYKNTPYFGAFPKIQYDINNTGFGAGSHETVTDIFFRLGIVKDILNNITSYYVYELDDSDTPEILAEKVYGDIGAGWIILYANSMLDPQFDWPLNYDAFQKMIIDRYGSNENATTQIHHYEKVIKRTNEFTGVTVENRYVIDAERLTEEMPNVPYTYWTPYVIETFRTADSSVFTSDDNDVDPPIFLSADLNYDDAVNVTKFGSVAFANETNTYSVDGKTVTETIYGEAVSNYDYELRNNDAKRLIKVIKSEYYNGIISEFAKLTNTENTFVRRLV